MNKQKRNSWLKQLIVRLFKFVGIYEWQMKWREVPISIRFVNFFFQRFLRLNGSCPWPVHFTSRVIYANYISLSVSARTFIALSGHCYLNGQNGIVIGEGTMIGPGVKIISANHCSHNFQEHTSNNPIRIGKDCWLATNSIVLPGVELGQGVVVAAGAVVTKSFESNCLLAGVPARKIRKI